MAAPLWPYALRRGERFGLCRIWAMLISDHAVARALFREAHGRPPRTPPVTFNERIIDRIGSGELRQFADLTDKVAVRDIVAQKVGKRYLVPQYATTKRLTRKLWEDLPDSFMLKPNHASSWSRLVSDKLAVDYETVEAETQFWLSKNFYYLGREGQYRDIEPCLLFDKILIDPHPNGLVDYKFFCFHGQPLLVQAVFRKPRKHRLHFDLDWNRLDFRHKVPNSGDVPRPARLEEMCAIAETLSEGFDFVRVDLFHVPEGVYFGELTLTPLVGCDGFDPSEIDSYLGDLWGGVEDVQADGLARWRADPTAPEARDNNRSMT